MIPKHFLSPVLTDQVLGCFSSLPEHGTIHFPFLTPDFHRQGYFLNETVLVPSFKQRYLGSLARLQREARRVLEQEEAARLSSRWSVYRVCEGFRFEDTEDRFVYMDDAAADPFRTCLGIRKRSRFVKQTLEITRTGVRTASYEFAFAGDLALRRLGQSFLGPCGLDSATMPPAMAIMALGSLINMAGLYATAPKPPDPDDPYLETDEWKVSLTDGRLEIELKRPKAHPKPLVALPALLRDTLWLSVVRSLPDES